MTFKKGKRVEKHGNIGTISSVRGNKVLVSWGMWDLVWHDKNELNLWKGKKRKPQFAVKPTRCDCHPETCCCGKYCIYDRYNDKVMADSSQRGILGGMVDMMNKQVETDNKPSA